MFITLSEQIDLAVDAFTECMREKLIENMHKGRWGNCSKQYLMTRLAQEKKELSAALKTEDAEAIVQEAADIANFAMMIADNFGNLKQKHSNHGKE